MNKGTRRTQVFRNEDRDRWVVKFWPDPFDMFWYERVQWRDAIRLAFRLERNRDWPGAG